MFLLLFIFILSHSLSLFPSLSSLHLFVCAHFTACPARLGSSFVVVVAIVLTLSLRQVSNVAEWPTPSSSSFTVAGSFLPLPYTLHSSLCPLFRGFICVGGKVSRRLVLPLLLSLLSLSRHHPPPLPHYLTLLRFLFVLHYLLPLSRPSTLCPAVALLRLPTNFTYIYSDIFQRPLLLLLCISYEIVYFSGGMCVCVCVWGVGVSVCVLVKCFHAAQLLKPLLDAATLFRLHSVPTLHSSLSLCHSLSFPSTSFMLSA